MACKVARSRHGTLALRLHWRGKRSWEGSGLRDTKANRQRLQSIADLVSAEIRAGVFTPERYLHYFPHGNRAHEFAPNASQRSAPPNAPTLDQYYETWIARQQPPLVRPAQTRDYRLHLTRYVLPTLVEHRGARRRLGDLPITEILPAHLVELQSVLVNTLSLSVKTARNIMDGSFRALLRDARAFLRDPETGTPLVTIDPFVLAKGTLIWPRRRTPPPDPFTTKERDRILEWFRKERPFYYPFIFTLFHTGMRPSEAVALRWGDIDTKTGTISISRSRYLGSEAPTKTAHSERTIRLRDDVRDVLRDIKPIHAEAEMYVFTNQTHGGPIDQRHWPRKHWQAALRELKVRPRKFYATKHTFISLALSAGVNLKWLADYCGTSVTMIERHYGRFLEERAETHLRLLVEGDNAPPSANTSSAARFAKPATLERRIAVRPEKALKTLVPGTGIEPVRGRSPTGF